VADYAPWVDKVYDQNVKDREGEIQSVLSDLAKKGSMEKKNLVDRQSIDAFDLAQSLVDMNEFEKPSFMTHLHTVPMSGRADYVRYTQFPEPVVAVKHKRLPLVLAVANKRSTFTGGKQEPIDGLNERFDIKQILSWATPVSHMKLPEKTKLAKILLDGISIQRKSKDGDEVWLTDFLSKQKSFKLAGFALNAPYINVDRSYGDTRPIWVHPWGIPTLYYLDDKLPVTMMISPALRLNENLLGSRNMEGYTG